jgi:hypothetical protein
MADFYEGMADLGDMSELEGLYDSLAGIQEDAMEFGIIGATALVSAGIAKFVVKTVSGLGPFKGAPWAPYAAGAIPVVVGILLGGQLRRYNNNVAIGTAVGMISYGLGHMLKGVAAVADYNPNVSLAGVGEYDYAAMNGVGYYPMSEGNYLNAAPVSVEDMAGLGSEAPVSVEMVDGLGSEAPVSVEEVSGLAATF